MKRIARKRRTRHNRVPGEYIVKMRDPNSVPWLCKTCESKPFEGWRVTPLPLKSQDTVLVSVPSGKEQAFDELVRELAEYVHPNHLWYPNRHPVDPRYRSRGMWGLRKVGAPAAWERTIGDKSVTVAVIDTGIDYNHEDLKENMWRDPVSTSATPPVHGANFADHPTNDPMDHDGHGTHIAGTIAAAGSNGTGVVGVNWRASLVAVRFMRFGVGQRGGSTGAAVQAIEYAVRKRAHIINASWGDTPKDLTLRQAIAEAGGEKVLFVTAAGGRFVRGGVDTDDVPHYPSCYDLENILVVQSSDADDRLTPDSNYGAKTVDIAAPGWGILSTFPGDQYLEMNGTSMATAYVSGAAALVKSLAPGWGCLEIKQQLLRTAKQLHDDFKGVSVTDGRLDVDAATQAPLTITRPTAQVRWTRRDEVLVSWQEKPVPSGCRRVELRIDLEASTDDGKSWKPLASNIDIEQGEVVVDAHNIKPGKAQVRAKCTGTKLFAYSEIFAIGAETRATGPRPQHSNARVQTSSMERR